MSASACLSEGLPAGLETRSAHNTKRGFTVDERNQVLQRALGGRWRSHLVEAKRLAGSVEVRRRHFDAEAHNESRGAVLAGFAWWTAAARNEAGLLTAGVPFLGWAANLGSAQKVGDYVTDSQSHRDTSRSPDQMKRYYMHKMLSSMLLQEMIAFLPLSPMVFPPHRNLQLHSQPTHVSRILTQQCSILSVPALAQGSAAG